MLDVELVEEVVMEYDVVGDVVLLSLIVVVLWNFSSVVETNGNVVISDVFSVGLTVVSLFLEDSVWDENEVVMIVDCVVLADVRELTDIVVLL